MKINREYVEKELERLRNKNAFSIDPESGELIEPKDISNLPPDVQAISRLSKEIGGLDNWEPTEYELEIGMDLDNLWVDFNENVQNCLELFGVSDKVTFFRSLEKLCKSLNDLWGSAIYDWETQSSVFKFMLEIDKEYYLKIEPQLWFCMYVNSEHDEVLSDIITHILNLGIGDEIPYPGYYIEEARKLLFVSKSKSEKEAEAAVIYNKLYGNLKTLLGLE